MWPNQQETADLVTFTEEIFNRKLHCLCSIIHGFYEWLSCTGKHKVVRGIDLHRNWLAQSQVEHSLFAWTWFQLNLLICTIGLESVKNNSPNTSLLKTESVRHTCFHFIKIELNDSVSYKMLQSVCQQHL